MKLNIQSTATISGDLAPSEFKIQANAKAFRVLSDNLYSDKIWAVIRELVANAVDSHKAAGQSRKVKVKLPTVLDPTFYVEDWGTGLSHEQIMTLYTTYFGSDKADSNSLIGGFGLGSKSPFALVDQFTVTSWFDGQRREYVCMLDGDLPKIVPGAVTSTDRHNGMRISLRAPDASKYKEWTERVIRLLPYMDLEVIPEIDFKRPQIIDTYLDRSGIKIELIDSNNQGMVVMGGIPYPIPKSLTAGLRSSMRIIAPVGAFDVAVSREQLALTNDLGGRIEQLFRNAEDYFIPKIEKEYGFDRMNLGELLQNLDSDGASFLKRFYLRKSPVNNAGQGSLIKVGNNGFELFYRHDCKAYIVELKKSVPGAVNVQVLLNPATSYLGKAAYRHYKGTCRAYMTWGVKRPTKENMAYVANKISHDTGVSDVIFIHIPEASLDKVIQIRSDARISDALLPLISMRTKDIKGGNTKGKTGTASPEKTFNDLAARLSIGHIFPNTIYVVLRLPKGLNPQSWDWRTRERKLNELLNLPAKKGLTKTFVNIIPVAHSAPKWVTQVAENAGLCTSIEEALDWFIRSDVQIASTDERAMNLLRAMSVMSEDLETLEHVFDQRAADTQAAITSLRSILAKTLNVGEVVPLEVFEKELWTIESRYSYSYKWLVEKLIVWARSKAVVFSPNGNIPNCWDDEFEFWVDNYHEMIEVTPPDVLDLIAKLIKTNYTYNPKKTFLEHKGFKKLINIMKENSHGN